MDKIKVGGFIEPFEPFGSDVDPSETGLQLHCSMPAEGDWYAVATWDSGGALAHANGTRMWDNSPIPEDPRANPQPFATFKPKPIGRDFIVGNEVFPIEDEITIGDPSVQAETEIDLNPGLLVIPTTSEANGLSWIDFSDVPAFRGQGIQNPQPPSVPGLALVEDPGYPSYWGYGDGGPFSPIEYGVHFRGNTIIIEKFYEDMTVAEVEADGARPQGAPPARDPQVGDLLATNINYEIFYQTYRGPYQVDEDGIIYYVAERAAGTWERWTYTRPLSGEKEVGPFEASATDNYGVRITGSSSENEERTGEIGQFSWDKDSTTLHKGVWSYTKTTTKSGSGEKPSGRTGPSQGDDSSPNGGPGWPNGWPSEKEAGDRDAGWWVTVNTYRPYMSYVDTEARVETLTWSFGATAQAPWVTTVLVEEPATTIPLTYDTRAGGAPYWEIRERPPVVKYRNPGNANWTGVPFVVGSVYGTSGGIFSYVLIGPSPPCWETSLSNVGVNNWVAGPPSGECTPWGYWYVADPEPITIVEEYAALLGTPPSDPPDTSDFDDTPGSGVPGGGGSPPDFGIPPQDLPEFDWDDTVQERVFYSLQSPVGPSHTWLREYEEITSSTQSNSASWNSGRGNSNNTNTGTSGTYTLRYTIPTPMIANGDEAIFLVRELLPSSQSTPFTSPIPYSSQTVYYWKTGDDPVPLNPIIESLFPVAAWLNPPEWRWDRNANVKDGVLCFFPGPTPDKDYRDGDKSIPVEAYRVSDGSVSPISGTTRSVKTLASANAAVMDVSA